MLYAFAAVIAADRSSNRRCMRAVRKTKENDSQLERSIAGIRTN